MTALLIISLVIYLLGAIIIFAFILIGCLSECKVFPLKAFKYILIWPALMFNQRLLNEFAKFGSEDIDWE